jgi:hypothetical protein
MGFAIRARLDEKSNQIKKVAHIIWLLLFMGIAVQAQPGDFENLIGPYLGQKPPGDRPEVFAPGIVSTVNHEYGISFSTDLNEIYLKRLAGGTRQNLVFSRENNRWRGPEEVQFAVEGNFGLLFIMPEGKHLLANQITKAADGEPQSTIVKFSRKNGRWGNPQAIGPGMRATTADSGHIYVTHVLDSKKSLGAIGRYKRAGDNYGTIEVLGDEINQKGISNAHPFIAPDESYLIFDSKKIGDDRGGLYISFNLGGGSWSIAVNLSKILNTGKNANDWCATVSPDGQYLFYSSGDRGQSDIYWVSAKIIEELRSKPGRE